MIFNHESSPFPFFFGSNEPLTVAESRSAIINSSNDILFDAIFLLSISSVVVTTRREQANQTFVTSTSPCNTDADLNVIVSDQWLSDSTMATDSFIDRHTVVGVAYCK